MNHKNCRICGNKLIFLKKLNKPQKTENLFNFSPKKFSKIFYECKNCLHIYNFHSFQKKIMHIYKKNYNSNSHKNIEEKFKKILNLDKKKSSNHQRIKALIPFIKKRYNILDIGSGIGIFPYSLKQSGYQIDCLEYDKNACKFLKKIGLKTIKKTILNFNIPKKYNFITFNKILEHLPIENIISILKNIKPKRILYLELPSVKAKKAGLKRQEFFLEHFNIFSKNSLLLLVKTLNYKIIKISDIKEVNHKYTLRAIIEKK